MEICIIGEKLKINVDIIQYNSIELILLTRCLLRRRKIWKKGSTIHVYYYTRVRIHVYAILARINPYYTTLYPSQRYQLHMQGFEILRYTFTFIIEAI